MDTTLSRSTISTFQLLQMFPDEETARLYLESRLWPEALRQRIQAAALRAPGFAHLAHELSASASHAAVAMERPKLQVFCGSTRLLQSVRLRFVPQLSA